MKAEIIAVGTEILLGDILNTNAQYISKELANLGIDLYYQTVVGDNPKRLKDTIYNAFSRADLVITTGGLGPTEDDLTKETGAEYFSKKLVLDEKALNRIKKFFEKTNRVMTENNIKQAYVPENSIVMYNDNGTAPGIIIEENNKIMILLPGPPKETVPMFEQQVRPFLISKQNYTLVSRVLRVADIGESMMETKVKDIIDGQVNPTIAPYAKDTESLLRITARGKDEDEANNLIEPVARKIYERLGSSIYAEGETSIEEVVSNILIEKNLTISTAESCTGGLLAATFIKYPGISKAFKDGIVSYSNDAKVNRLNVKRQTIEKYGAVSPQTAIEMAEGVAKTSNTNIGISTTGVAGPGGGTKEKPVGLVYVGICINGQTQAKEFRFAGNREKIRTRTVSSALNWLRLILSNM